jgi:hypothetical protein
MILDSEKQREEILFCIKNVVLQGTMDGLAPVLSQIANLQEVVKVAKVQEGSADKK